MSTTTASTTTKKTTVKRKVVSKATSTTTTTSAAAASSSETAAAKAAKLAEAQKALKMRDSLLKAYADIEATMVSMALTPSQAKYRVVAVRDRTEQLVDSLYAGTAELPKPLASIMQKLTVMMEQSMTAEKISSWRFQSLKQKPQLFQEDVVWACKDPSKLFTETYQDEISELLTERKFAAFTGTWNQEVFNQIPKRPPKTAEALAAQQQAQAEAMAEGIKLKDMSVLPNDQFDKIVNIFTRLGVAEITEEDCGVILPYIDGSDEFVQERDTLFNLFDVDRSGAVSLKEVIIGMFFLKWNSLDAKTVETKMKEELGATCKHSKAQDWLTKTGKELVSTSEVMFDIVDIDKSGSVESEELAKWASKANMTKFITFLFEYSKSLDKEAFLMRVRQFFDLITKAVLKTVEDDEDEEEEVEEGEEGEEGEEEVEEEEVEEEVVEDEDEEAKRAMDAQLKELEALEHSLDNASNKDCKHQ